MLKRASSFLAAAAVLLASNAVAAHPVKHHSIPSTTQTNAGPFDNNGVPCDNYQFPAFPPDECVRQGYTFPTPVIMYAPGTVDSSTQSVDPAQSAGTYGNVSSPDANGLVAGRDESGRSVRMSPDGRVCVSAFYTGAVTSVGGGRVRIGVVGDCHPN